MADYPAFSAAVRGWTAPSVTRRRLIVGAAAVLGAGPLLVGCGKSSEKTSSSKLDQVTYLTGLGATGKESYVWVADAKGYFADEGIKVTIEQGAAGDSNLNMLNGGKAQFAAIDYAGAVRRAGDGSGQFKDVRVIAVIYAKSLMALHSLASSNIRQAMDLIGKRIAQTTGAVTKDLFSAYAGQAGLSDAQIQSVQWQETASTSLPQLLGSKKVDAVGTSLLNQPMLQAAAKVKVTSLPYSRYLGDLYGDVIAAPTSLDAGLQERFIRATWRGLLYAVGHPDEAGDILQASVPTVKSTVSATALRMLPDYVRSPVVDPSLVTRSISLLQSVHTIPGGKIEPSTVANFEIASKAVAGLNGSARP